MVSGIGLVSPLGCGKEPNWENLIAGQSGIGPSLPSIRDPTNQCAAASVKIVEVAVVRPPKSES